MAVGFSFSVIVPDLNLRNGLCRSPALDTFFRIDTKPVGDSRDVVEITNHLASVMNRPGMKPMAAKVFEILGHHFELLFGQLAGKLA